MNCCSALVAVHSYISRRQNSRKRSCQILPFAGAKAKVGFSCCPCKEIRYLRLWSINSSDSAPVFPHKKPGIFLSRKSRVLTLPEKGLEPSLPCEKQILSLSRLPFRHSGIIQLTEFRILPLSRTAPEQKPRATHTAVLFFPKESKQNT